MTVVTFIYWWKSTKCVYCLTGKSPLGICNASNRGTRSEAYSFRPHLGPFKIKKSCDLRSMSGQGGPQYLCRSTASRAEYLQLSNEIKVRYSAQAHYDTETTKIYCHVAFYCVSFCWVDWSAGLIVCYWTTSLWRSFVMKISKLL